MRLRSALVCLALLLAFAGCRKSPQISSTDSLPQLPKTAADTVFRVHWIGKRQLAADGTAFYFNRLWDLQESSALEVRTLNALATLPWRVLRGNRSLPNAPEGLLRDLLESLKYEESYLEIRSSADDPLQLALAVRLSPARAAMWQSNLALIVDSLTDVRALANPKAERWSVVLPQSQITISLTRQGEWSIFGVVGPRSSLIKELRDRIVGRSYPFGAPVRSYWLQAEIDLPWMARVLGTETRLSTNLPKASVSVTGDGVNVLTHAVLNFSNPTPAAPDRLTIPASLIREPLTSLSVMRGVQFLLSNEPAWNGLRIGPAPDQLFFWSGAENPFQVYAAAVLPDARSRMETLTDHLLNQVNPWLTNNGPRVNNAGIPVFEKLPTGDGVRWTLEGVWPFIRAADSDNANFLFVGLSPGTQTSPFRTNRVGEISRTNLVYWSWENTSARLKDWLPVLQTARVLAHHAPMPDRCLSLAWLASLEQRVRDSETRILRTTPNQWQLDQKSTIGLSALELHLLADWLESPDFPRKLHTFAAPPPDSSH